jgi:signal transduction histidine kinase
MFVCDSMTAILLFAQFSVVRSRAILVLASGYLFTALILIPWILTFPGVFVAAGGLLGGLQSTSWLYFAQHAGLPLFVIGYALSRDAGGGGSTWHGAMRGAFGVSVAATAALVAVVAFICIAGEAFLPRVVLDSLRLGPLWPYVGAPVALLSAAALVVLWIRRRSMLDLWLMVVMSLYTIEIPLSYYPDPVRFSVGWYAVRVIGFFSSTVLLVVLLYEIKTLYARLTGAVRAERRERVARLMTGDAVAATVAHEVKQPLTSMITSAAAGLRFLDRPVPNLERAKDSFKKIVADGHRAGEVVASIRAVFRHDVRTWTSLDVNELVREALALHRTDLQKHDIVVQAEPDRHLPEVQGDRIQLQQVLHNLITNAIDAMASMDGSKVLNVTSARYETEGVVVSVADTGPGISPENGGRVFNALFTTKPDGMGMGLAICRAIVEAHEGRLWATSNTPHGAVFQFTLRATSSLGDAARREPLSAGSA